MEYWHYSWQHHDASGGFLLHSNHFIFTGHAGFTNRVINQLLARNRYGYSRFTHLLAFNKLDSNPLLFQKELKAVMSNRTSISFFALKQNLQLLWHD